MDFKGPGKLTQQAFMKAFTGLVTKGDKTRELKFNMAAIVTLVDENPSSAMTLMKVLAERVLKNGQPVGQISDPETSFDMHCLGALAHAYINARGSTVSTELIGLYRDYPVVVEVIDYTAENARKTR